MKAPGPAYSAHPGLATLNNNNFRKLFNVKNVFSAVIIRLVLKYSIVIPQQMPPINLIFYNLYLDFKASKYNCLRHFDAEV